MTPQHLDALARANEIRCARSAIKRELKSGTLLLSDLLREEPMRDCLAAMAAEDLLCAVWRLYRKTVRQFLDEVGCSYSRRLGELTYRQRRKLAVQMQEWERRNNRSGRRARSHITRHGVGRVGGSRKQAA